MIVTRLRTIHPINPLTLDGTVLKESVDVILGVTFDAHMTFEKHLHSVSRAAAQRLGWYHQENPCKHFIIDRSF